MAIVVRHACGWVAFRSIDGRTESPERRVGGCRVLFQFLSEGQVKGLEGTYRVKAVKIRFSPVASLEGLGKRLCKGLPGDNGELPQYRVNGALFQPRSTSKCGEICSSKLAKSGHDAFG
jgi:hypothetical protein